ncbi:hypothetical protein [Flavobacterium sp.]|uniref:hypothetical protein n=1 Tax=Flavobacterium sp. TaxID=239 RepID=UPI00326633EF
MIQELLPLDGLAFPIWVVEINNDLTISNKSGDIWKSSFNGKSISVMAPKEVNAGKIEVKIDGKIHGMTDLSIKGSRKSQQLVYKVNGLAAGKHSIEIINKEMDQ